MVGIISVFSFRFIYHSINTYQLIKTQGELYQEGTYALERITRELRDASFNLDVSGGISFIKAHQTPSDPNTFVRYYQTGSSLYRCSDATAGSICLSSPSASSTNRLVSSNIGILTMRYNDNNIGGAKPCTADPATYPNCQDDSFTITITLQREGQAVTLNATVTPKNYCAPGASATSCNAQDYDYNGRSFNSHYEDIVY